MTNKIFTYIGIAILLATFTLGSAFADGTYGPVKKRDYLGTIIKKAYPQSNLKPQQIMVAILRANPSAFKGHNIHFIKTGAILNLPSDEIIKAIDNREATIIIEKHYGFFKRGKTGNLTLKPLPKIEPSAPKIAASNNAVLDAKTTTEITDTPKDIDAEIIAKSDDIEQGTKGTNEDNSLENKDPDKSNAKTEASNDTNPDTNELDINDKKELANKETNHSYQKLDSLESIRSQQNKTIDLLDQQIEVIEKQIHQTTAQKEQAQSTKPTDVDTQKAASAQKPSTNDSSSTPTATIELDEDVVIEDTNTTPETIADEQTTETKEEKISNDATIQPNNTSTVATKTEEKTDSSTPQKALDNLNQPWQLAILVGILSLLGLIAFRAFRKPEVNQEAYDTSALQYSTPETADTPAINQTVTTNDDLLSPVVKTAKEPIYTVTDSDNEEEMTQTHEDVDLKINMAKAYIDMGYTNAAKEILEEASHDSSEQQQTIIDELLEKT